MIRQAFEKLYPKKEFNYKPVLKYSSRFKDFGANIKLYGNTLEIALSRKWKTISKEIRIGLIQELMLRLFHDKKDSMYIDLYNKFVKKLHIAIPKTDIDPVLEQSFDRVNERYFYGFVEKPNLVWGGNSKTSLGSYDYKIDTIKISRVFTSNKELIDFVMYHEILHKKNKFQSKQGRTVFHDKKFRDKERQFENHKDMEKKLNSFLRRPRFFGV